MAEQSKYQYTCSEGHQIYSEREQTKCIVFIKGSPCKGKLASFGRGSRTKTKETK